MIIVATKKGVIIKLEEEKLKEKTQFALSENDEVVSITSVPKKGTNYGINVEM